MFCMFTLQVLNMLYMFTLQIPDNVLYGLMQVYFVDFEIDATSGCTDDVVTVSEISHKYVYIYKLL